MSSLTPSHELAQTAEIREALTQLETSSSKAHEATQAARYNPERWPSRNPEVETITHRCRLYRIESKALPKGTFIYTVVRDTVEDPTNSEKLPQGDIVFDVSDTSLDVVQAKTKVFRESLGRVDITDWRAFGSI